MHRRQLVLAAVLLLAVACVPGPNAALAPDDGAGFWKGLWHGAIFFVSLVWSFFSDGVSVYEVRNTGGWYDLGYFLGLTVSVGGGSHGATRKGRRGKDRPKSEE